MNKTRRNKLNALQDRISALNIEAVTAAIKEIHEELEAIRDEEQESFDNLPESLQDGERGQDMQAAISSIEEAMTTLEAIAESEDVTSEAVSSIEDAKGVA